MFNLRKWFVWQELLFLWIILIIFLGFVFYETINLMAYNSLSSDFKKDVFFKQEYWRFDKDIKQSIYDYFNDWENWEIQYVNSEEDVDEKVLWCKKKVIAIVNWERKEINREPHDKDDFYFSRDKVFEPNDLKVSFENSVYVYHCYYWFNPIAVWISRIW